ncbi:MAG: hypothetical protein ACRBCK_06220 [Alphaproteobacteria bacterium]
MPEIILYLTDNDANTIREWLNQNEDVTWFVNTKVEPIPKNPKDLEVYPFTYGSDRSIYSWKTQNVIPSTLCRDMYLYHNKTNIEISCLLQETEESVEKDIKQLPDGWKVDSFNMDAPIPSTKENTSVFCFTALPEGREHKGSIGRSGFTWIGNKYSPIGHAAPEVCNEWWKELKKFIRKNSTAIQWLENDPKSKIKAYAFPEAYEKIQSGCPRDLNPPL